LGRAVSESVRGSVQTTFISFGKVLAETSFQPCLIPKKQTRVDKLKNSIKEMSE
jgi:hypothetical protein